jgi:hypothetical protein
MKQLATFFLVSSATVLTSISVLAETPQWIDPKILKQLQDIESVDRSKFTPQVARRLAENLSKTLTSVTISSGTSKKVIPELHIPDQPVIVISGKNKNIMGRFRREPSPIAAGAATFELVYDQKGNPLRSAVILPGIPSDGPPPFNPASPHPRVVVP